MQLMWSVNTSIQLNILKVDMDIPQVNVLSYSHIVGKLIFLGHSSPHLSHVVDVVSRYMHSP